MKLNPFLIFLLFQWPLSVNGKARASPHKEQQPLIGSATPNRPNNEIDDYGFWKLNFSSEAPHYFASVYGLLQQWPNTFFPNGHIIAPGEIQPFTKLYHGWFGDRLPESPEWLAFDIEMSYGIMGSTSNSFMLTYQTTRTVKVLYFDGESAALQGTGQLDSQMLHIFGNVTGPLGRNHSFDISGEYIRAAGLCNWIYDKKLGGVGWGFEGIVRMNTGFELIWCNFTSPSLKLISKINVTAPELGHPSSTGHLNEALLYTQDYKLKKADKSLFSLPSSTTSTDRAPNPTKTSIPIGRSPMYQPFYRAEGWSWFTSATKHYGSSGLGPRLGECRVKLSSYGVLNYYSTEFKSQGSERMKFEQKYLNLTSEGLWLGPRGKNGGTRTEALKKLMRRRRYHRLNKIDERDALRMRENAERVLLDILENKAQNSGADWHMIANEIVQTYALGLIQLHILLKSSDRLRATKYTAVRDWMFVLRAKNHAFLLPFLQYPLDISDHNPWKPGSDLAKETFALCKYHHTRLLVPGEGIHLSREEELLKWAVEETMSAICYVTQEIGFAVEDTWLTYFNDYEQPLSRSWEEEELRADVQRWTHGVEELMAWLGWAGEWVRCEEMCAWDEDCAIPMWPVLYLMKRPRNDVNRSQGGEPPEYEPHNSYYRYPPERPGREIDDEADLWEPRCVKAD